MTSRKRNEFRRVEWSILGSDLRDGRQSPARGGEIGEHLCTVGFIERTNRIRYDLDAFASLQQSNAAFFTHTSVTTP
jgi:hypothetical protein